ncbi:MAG: GAF domain-containing protein [Holophagales bacterium]|nr:GAF domain-containing protein [Holophagales bacterium]
MTWSPGLYGIAGRDPSEPAERLDAAGLLVPASAILLAEALAACRRSLTPYELDLELVRPDGAVRQVIARGEPLSGPDGSVSGLRGTIQDVSRRRRAEEIVRRDGERVETLSCIAWRLAERLDLESVLLAVCTETARAMHSDAAVFSFYDPASRTFRHGAAIGLGDVPRRFLPAPGAALDALAAEPGAVLVLPDRPPRPLPPGSLDAAAREEPAFRSGVIAAAVQGASLVGCLSALTVDGPRVFTEEETAQLRALAGLAAQALTNSQLFEAAQRKAQRTELVASVAQALSVAGTDVRSLLATTVRRTAELLDGACVLALLSEDGRRLDPVASHDPDEAGLETLPLEAEICSLDVPGNESDLAARVVATGRPLYIPDSTGGMRRPSPVPDYQPQIERSGSPSLLVVPLRAQGKAIGTLGLSREIGKERFTREDQEFLAELADRAAMAVTNARLYEEARARTEELSTLLSLATRLRRAQSPRELLPLALGEIRTLVGADGGAVALAEQDGGGFQFVSGVGHLEPCAGLTDGDDEGACGAVRRTGQPLVLDGPADGSGLPAGFPVGAGLGPQAFIPLQSETGLLGVLVVVRLKAPAAKAFSRAEVRLLSTCGEMVGNALRRMLLFEDARRRLKFAEALRRIDLAIIGTTDERIPLQAVLEELRSLLEVEAADVLLHDPRFHSLSWAAGFGFRTPAVQHTVQRVGESHAGLVALERRTLRIARLEAEEGRRGHDAVLAREGFVSYIGVPLVTKGQVLGVLEVFHRRPFDPDPEWLETLDVLAGQASLAIDNASMFDRLQRSRVDLELAYDETIEGWSRALDLRDNETEGHTQRVKDMTLRLARAMGFPEDELIQIQRGALLHDIGKMGVPDGILLKPGPLTDEEWVLMRGHARLAFELLSPIAYLRPAIDIPYAHHERWDGSGYPRGLKGKEIPRAARTFAVVDVWDALRSDRPYRTGWPEEKVITYIEGLSGTHFDPEVVEAFLAVCRG